MSLAGDVALTAREAIETAVPATRLVKPILYAIAVVLAIAAIGVAYWLVIARPRQDRVKAAAATVEATTAHATASAAQAAIPIIVDNSKVAAAIDALTRSNTHDIQSAAGASTLVDPALDRVGRTALCLRSAYRGDPACASLRGAGGGVRTAEADAGSAAPAR